MWKSDFKYANITGDFFKLSLYAVCDRAVRNNCCMLYNI